MPRDSLNSMIGGGDNTPECVVKAVHPLTASTDGDDAELLLLLRTVLYCAVGKTWTARATIIGRPTVQPLGLAR